MATERQLKILEAFVSVYNQTSLPVASAQLIDESGKCLGIKSAALRDELATLEKEGYLQNSYKRSGRVPTNKGFEYYLNKIHNTPESKIALRKKLDKILEKREKGIDWILNESMKLIETSTKSLIITKKVKKGVYLENIKIYNMLDEKILMIIEDSNGKIYNNEFPIKQHKDFVELEKVISIISSKIVGYEISELESLIPQVEEIIKLGIYEFEERFQLAIKNIFNKMMDIDQKVTGTSELISNNYFKEIDKLQNLFNFVESQTIWDIIDNSKAIEAQKANVSIGIESLEDFSIIYRDIKSGNEKTSVAIVSNKAQNYEEFFNILEMIEEELDE